jgi:hypothetical protein
MSACPRSARESPRRRLAWRIAGCRQTAVSAPSKPQEEASGTAQRAAALTTVAAPAPLIRGGARRTSRARSARRTRAKPADKVATAVAEERAERSCLALRLPVPHTLRRSSVGRDPLRFGTSAETVRQAATAATSPVLSISTPQRGEQIPAALAPLRAWLNATARRRSNHGDTIAIIAARW